MARYCAHCRELVTSSWTLTYPDGRPAHYCRATEECDAYYRRSLDLLTDYSENGLLPV